MTREEKNELLTQLGSEDYEAYMELRRQMDVLAADERDGRRAEGCVLCRNPRRAGAAAQTP